MALKGPLRPDWSPNKAKILKYGTLRDSCEIPGEGKLSPQLAVE